MGIDASRRGFFGVLTGAFAAAPAVGKDLAARLSGAVPGLPRDPSFRGLAARLADEKVADNYGEDAENEELESQEPLSWAERQFKRQTRNLYEQAQQETSLKMLEAYGPPPHVVRDAHQAAQELALAGLPPHIACLRSFSATAKHRMAYAYYFEAAVIEAMAARLSLLKNAEYEQKHDRWQRRRMEQIAHTLASRLGLSKSENASNKDLEDSRVGVDRGMSTGSRGRYGRISRRLR